MNHESARAFIEEENKKLMLEISGQSRFEITSCRLMADGDRLVTIIDHNTSKKIPHTYLYSKIPYVNDLDIQDLFIRHKRLIEEGIHDD